VTLEVGDYVLSPTMAVERKALPDLLQSLASGRYLILSSYLHFVNALSFRCGVKKFCLGIYCQGSFLSVRSENVLPWYLFQGSFLLVRSEKVLPWYLLSRLFPFGAE